MYVANRGTSQILQVPVNPDGSAGTAVIWYTISEPFWILIDQNTMYVHKNDGNIARILFVGDLPGTVLNPWATAGVPTPNGLVISGNYLYAASGAGVSSIFQINISTGIVVTSNWVDPIVVDRFHSLVVKGNFMYATNGATDQVSRIQINPDGSSGSIVQQWAPALTGTGFLTELIIVGPYMYVANATNGTIAQVRMTDGSLVNSTWATGFTRPHSFALRNGCLYVANYIVLGSISRFCSSDLLLTDDVSVMSCSALGSSKDINAQFSTRIYSSSDVTRMIRNNGIRNNYLERAAKGDILRGGAPHSDLYAIAHTAGSYAAASSLTTVSYSSCIPCTSAGGSGIPFQPAVGFGVLRNIIQY